jgi:hypothetical protein
MKRIHPIALKEWAIAVDALETGQQIIILRKGGIIEETRDFQLESDAFFLFPTYEHQKKQLLKDAYQPRLDQILNQTDAKEAKVLITSYAEATADIEVNSQEELNRLLPFHIWTEYFAEERLKWKRTKPLHVLILRVYKLEQALELPILPEYNGCKSWIGLNVELSQGISRSPVLSDEEFSRKKSQIESKFA